MLWTDIPAERLDEVNKALPELLTKKQHQDFKRHLKLARHRTKKELKSLGEILDTALSEKWKGLFADAYDAHYYPYVIRQSVLIALSSKWPHTSFRLTLLQTKTYFQDFCRTLEESGPLGQTSPWRRRRREAD